MSHQELYDKIFASDPGKNSPKDLLQAVTSEYPYFSVAHFFLLKESAATDFNYKKIAAKTALYFNNPFLLNYQLNRKVRMVGTEKIEEEVAKVTEVTEVTEVAEVHEFQEFRELQKTDTVENEVKAVKKDELLFEPLHTTDYFASQGIKLSEEVQPGDKLGQQLKSFTDWLKTMKKVNHGKLPEGNTQTDLAVQNLAEKSNKEQEILTESMAEVYLQQGKSEKARDIYKKLSLLNPAKSAYFAAKIELLKEN